MENERKKLQSLVSLERLRRGEKQVLWEDRWLKQEGYTIALSQKIEFYDENRNPV